MDCEKSRPGLSSSGFNFFELAFVGKWAWPPRKRQRVSKPNQKVDLLGRSFGPTVFLRLWIKIIRPHIPPL